MFVARHNKPITNNKNLTPIISIIVATVSTGIMAARLVVTPNKPKTLPLIAAGVNS